MMPVYFSTAFGALSPKQNIADNRDIMVKGDTFFTAGAMRSREKNGLLQGNAINYDVEKAAQSSAQKSYEDGNYGNQGRSPSQLFQLER